jgi:hypothetical protein
MNCKVQKPYFDGGHAKQNQKKEEKRQAKYCMENYNMSNTNPIYKCR